MAQPRNLAEQFEGDPEAVPIVDDVVIATPDEIAELRATVAIMAARIAELEPKPEESWPALKVVAFNTSMVGETLRDWCVKGLVTARREGAHWYVDESSVLTRQRRLGHRK
jgi:hypothetical protein